jgi:3-oxoacyl-[acyl-carrier-protein] synthase II
MNEKRRVVITGVGTYNPLGHDLETTWQKIMKGESGIGPITRFDASEHKTQFAGDVKDFDPDAFVGR